MITSCYSCFFRQFGENLLYFYFGQKSPVFSRWFACKSCIFFNRNAVPCLCSSSDKMDTKMVMCAHCLLRSGHVLAIIWKESCRGLRLLFFSLFSRSELSHIASRHRVDGIYCEYGLSSIYFIMIPVIICFILTDGRMEIDRIFEARALYYVLQISCLWKLTEGVQTLFTTQVSIERIEVLVRGVS